MPRTGPSFNGVNLLCEAAGGRITGTATTYASSTVGGLNFLAVTLFDSAGNTVATNSGPSPLSFNFPGLANQLYTLVASDDSAEPAASDEYDVLCNQANPGNPTSGCDLAITALVATPNTNPAAAPYASGGPGFYEGTGTITATATTSHPPITFAFTPSNVTFNAPAGSGVPTLLQSYNPTAPGALAPGLTSGRFTIYATDASGCVVNQSVTVADVFTCNIQAEVGTYEDLAYVRNLGTNQLEYDWLGTGTYTDDRFRAGYEPGTYTLPVRDKLAPTCTDLLEFTIEPYSLPRLCCVYFLVIGGQWYRIEEPTGLDSQELQLKRDGKLHGVNFEYSELSLGFDCAAGFGLIDPVYEAEGADAQVGYVELKRDASSAYGMKLVYQGLLNLYDATIGDDVFNCNVESSSSATLLASRFKTSLDLLGTKTLDGSALNMLSARPKRIGLHSRSIVKIGHWAADGSYADSGVVSDKNGQREPFIVLGFGNAIIDGLETFYQQQSGFSFIQEKYPFYKAKEAGPVTVEFNVDGRATIALSKGDFNEVFCELFWQVNNQPAERLVYIHQDGLTPCIPFLNPNCDPFGPLFDSDDYGQGFRASGTKKLTLAVGDELYLYGKLFVEDYKDGSEFTFGLLLSEQSFVKVTAETISEETDAQAFLAYEALDRALEIALGKPDLLRSNFYGRPDSLPRAYSALGPGGNFALANGFMIRRVAQKPFAPSFQDLLDGFQPPHNVGLAVDTTGSTETVRIEAAEDFYENRLALRVESCENFVRKVSAARQYNLVNIGFEKWKPEGRVENGLDEICSQKQYSTPIRRNAAEYKQQSKFVAGGYLLEAQRRVGASGDDGKNDTDTFIIAVQADAQSSQVLAWSSYGDPAIVVPIFASQIVANVGDQVVVTSGPNAGTYTVLALLPDNSGASGTPYATAIRVKPALPSVGAPVGLGVQVLLGNRYRAEKDDLFPVLDNVLSKNTIYNARLTPRRMLSRHYRFLNSATWFKRPGDLYRMTLAEGNLLVKSRMIGEATVLDEAADVQRQALGPLADTLFIPEEISFKTYLDQDGFDQLLARRHGYIAVFDGADWYTAYILNIKWKREDNQGTFQLLRRAANFDATVNLRDGVEFNLTEHNEPEFN